jgi:F0F1-type ATP synthase assembly protein I
VPPEDSGKRLARQQRQILYRYAGLGTELAGGLAGFVLLGWWIDRSLGSSPKAIVTCAIIGCVGGLYNTIRRAILMQKEMDRAARQESAERRDDAEPR